MRQMIKEMAIQLGIYKDCVDTHFGYAIRTEASYLHYDYIEPFVKLNVFKGIACIDNKLELHFIE